MPETAADEPLTSPEATPARLYRVDPVEPGGQLVGLTASLLAEYIPGAYPHDTRIAQWRDHDRIALAAVGPARDVTPGAEDFLGFWLATSLTPWAGEPAGVVALKRRADWDTYIQHDDTLTLSSTAVELTKLYVRPDHRGTGLARQLIDVVSARAEELGMRLYLTAYAVDETRAEWTSPDAITSRHRARALYHSAGFVEDGFPVPYGLDRLVYDPRH